MSAKYPPKSPFSVYDDELPLPPPSQNANPNNGEKFRHNSLSPNHSGVALDKTRSSLYKGGSFPEKTNSTLLPNSHNNSDLNTDINGPGADDPTQPHVHRHRHHHHNHDHGHQHHHHEHVHEHVHEHEHDHPHQHHEHVHGHDHHHHEHDQHQHEHNHHHHHHEHTPPLPPIHHHHHHHQQHEQQHSDTPSALTIRRHTPGVTDPTLYNFPMNYSPDRMYSSPIHNVSLPPNVHVTIRRNPAQAEHTLIQPILYPVALFTNSSAPQPIREVPKPRTPVRTRPEPRIPTPKPPTPKPRTPMRTSPIPPVYPAKSSPPPPPPPPPVVKSPVRIPVRPPPVSPVQPEPIPSPVPPPQKRKSVLIRKPIRTEFVQPTVQRVIKAPVQTPRPVTRVIVQEPPANNQYYRRPAVYPTPRRSVSYRTVPGMTTREKENEEIDDTGAPIYVQTPRVQTVTYRT
ncbi:hypothetical protein I4U23_024850 [Adineta vaga]|nr:hypothetical protein I4U23_024850 [Adineta vaga]